MALKTWMLLVVGLLQLQWPTQVVFSTLESIDDSPLAMFQIQGLCRREAFSQVQDV